MSIRALSAALLGGLFIFAFAAPAGLLQLGQLQLALTDGPQTFLSAPGLKAAAARLHMADVIAGLAFVAYIWLALIPLFRILTQDRSRGFAFAALFLGVNLICLISAPAPLYESARNTETAGLLGIAGFVLFAAGLSFFLVGESPFASFAYLSWALVGLLAANDLANRVAADPALQDTWIAIAGAHAAGAAILLAIFALLETRALLWRARGSRIISALLAVTLCMSAAAMVVYQYRLGLAGLQPDRAVAGSNADEDTLHAAIASFTLLGAGLIGVIRHAFLMRTARSGAQPNQDQPSMS